MIGTSSLTWQQRRERRRELHRSKRTESSKAVGPSLLGSSDECERWQQRRVRRRQRRQRFGQHYRSAWQQRRERRLQRRRVPPSPRGLQRSARLVGGVTALPRCCPSGLGTRCGQAGGPARTTAKRPSPGRPRPPRGRGCSATDVPPSTCGYKRFPSSFFTLMSAAASPASSAS
jgi:hypothetical protein